MFPVANGAPSSVDNPVELVNVGAVGFKIDAVGVGGSTPVGIGMLPVPLGFTPPPPSPPPQPASDSALSNPAKMVLQGHILRIPKP